jgi:hypothetical protein
MVRYSANPESAGVALLWQLTKGGCRVENRSAAGERLEQAENHCPPFADAPGEKGLAYGQARRETPALVSAAEAYLWT